MRNTLIAVVGLCLVSVVSCDDNSPTHRVHIYRGPRTAVQQLDSIEQSLRSPISEALREAGWYPRSDSGWAEAGGSDSVEYDMNASMWGLSKKDSILGLYHGTIEITNATEPETFGTKDGRSATFHLPAFITLHFVTRGTDNQWYMLTEDGFVFNLMKDDLRSDLPMSVQRSIVDAVSHTLPVEAWWQIKDELHSRLDSSATHTDSG